jgi:amphi-Trp domain-containing protein
MSDVKLERKELVSRAEAADLLATLARAFTAGGHTELPFGPGIVTLHIPDSVRAEFEVEVEGDEIELEIEFKWSLAQHAPGSPAAAAGQDHEHNGRNGRPPGKKPRSKQQAKR